MGGSDVVDGAVSQRVDGEIEGIFLDNIVHDDVLAKIRLGLQRQKVGLVLFGEIVHDRHRTKSDWSGTTKPAPALRYFQHKAPASDAMGQKGEEMARSLGTVGYIVFHVRRICR